MGWSNPIPVPFGGFPPFENGLLRGHLGFQSRVSLLAAKKVIRQGGKAPFSFHRGERGTGEGCLKEIVEDDTSKAEVRNGRW